ncbi:MAG: PDDEXK nuclease domain-containing protein [Prevotellaceae bacterium]|jgi:predicted nuclease of restriction endonuclease-like (RecB) superfamily|nr:PDDEXK nuclease domain-containing protein [Prevotellaceae bacterium]
MVKPTDINRHIVSASADTLLEFTGIVRLIKQSQQRAIQAVNTALITLYWNVGKYISKRIEASAWGEKTVNMLADYIRGNEPELKGFDRRGLYRMKQFYDTYAHIPAIVSPAVTQLLMTEDEDSEIVSPLVTQFGFDDISTTVLTKISWSHHLIIMSRSKTDEECEFYIKLCIKESYSKRELDRQISAGCFERTMLGNVKLSPTVKEIYANVKDCFKDNYVLEFVGLPDSHSESDLQKGLILRLRNFILELGKDFLFVDEEYKVQVGNSDFYIDLLFYHRELQCLVAFELKADKFKPEHLGQLNFYLEALDRDVRKSHENPSIGILLCKDSDAAVVEYALSRTLSPAMVSEYQTRLPDKKILQQKLHELFEQNV